RLDMALPVEAILAVLAAMSLVSVVTLLRLRSARPVRDGELFGQLLLDIAALTAIFYLSGGSGNPFVMLYLLPLTVGAAALPGKPVWVLTAITTICYSSLHFRNVPLPHSEMEHGGGFGLHVLGMWLGFVLAASLIAGFAARMSATLRERERALASLREQALREERVVALGTLAAGAAHEFGTPLATMAVLVKDIVPGEAVSAGKLDTLRAQIARCKAILGSLSAAAGQLRAEAGQGQALDAFLEEIIARWRALRADLKAEVSLDGVRPAPRILAEQTLAQAIVNILNNAADASPQSVEVQGHWTEELFTLDISDRGPGLAPEIARQPGEAILSTKSEGLGLGLFLARTTLQRLGGNLDFSPRVDGGLVCRIALPLATLRIPDAVKS
ncbi:MAG: ATP-binding protein, partial [Gammaproteobacteria bacterium]|nr:ATP-binding protein [Gammaproteobacteria bacterium]